MTIFEWAEGIVKWVTQVKRFVDCFQLESGFDHPPFHKNKISIMKPFEVTSFKVDQVTGFTDLEIVFDIGTGEKSEKRWYQKEDSARAFIAEIKRDYILVMFSRYVNHSLILFETGDRAFYKTPERLASLDRCKNANTYFQNLILGEICKYILRIEEDLRRILPSPNNNSRSSSEDRLINMIVFSKKVIQNSSSSIKSVAHA